ncbi:MAG: hypothetical protein ACKVX7_10445 [Planctomycetota bacterium]
MSQRVVRRSALGFALCSVFLLARDAKGLADEVPPVPGRATTEAPIVFLKVETTPVSGGGWKFKFSGKKTSNVELPGGTIFDMTIRSGARDLDSFTLELKHTKLFDAEFESKKIDAFLHGLIVKASIFYEKQPPEVKEFFDKNPVAFPKGSSPWKFSLHEPPINLGTPADIEKQTVEVRKFFEQQLKSLLQADQKLTTEGGKAASKQSFVKNDKFDTESWQIWIEKEVREPIRKVQREISAAKKSARFLSAERDLNKYLKDIGAAVARRSYQKSLDLYRSLGVAEDPRDQAPKDVDAVSKRFRDEDLKKLVDLLCESQQITLK